MSNLDTLARDPAAITRELAERARGLKSDATSGELIYTPQAPASYYRDLLAMHGKGSSPGCEKRLTRHAEQMDRANRDRRASAERGLRAGGFAYRVEPNTNDGTGGFFSPPIWVNRLFATANRPGRVLADLMPRFPLPPGVSSINLPIIATGSSVQSQTAGTGVPSQDITDSAGSSNVTTLDGFVDVGLQLLEQSPPSASTDWAISLDLAEATDAQLETQLIAGTAVGPQLRGVMNVTGANNVTFTNASPTGALMYPYLGQTFAQVSDNRFAAPQCWLMRGARWAWIKTSEGSDGLPFDIAGTTYLGSTDDTPDPIGGLVGLPVFLDEVIPANLSGNPGSFVPGGGTQDAVLALRPADLVLFEGDPQTMVAREPLSGTLGARIEMHTYAAAINRRPAAVGVLGGTGLAKPNGF